MLSAHSWCHRQLNVALAEFVRRNLGCLRRTIGETVGEDPLSDALDGQDWQRSRSCFSSRGLDAEETPEPGRLGLRPGLHGD
jgi:hypothetical protein